MSRANAAHAPHLRPKSAANRYDSYADKLREIARVVERLSPDKNPETFVVSKLTAAKDLRNIAILLDGVST